MNTAARAYRILKQLTAFTEAKSWHGDLARIPAPLRFGELVGTYLNPGPDGTRLDVFVEGVTWFDQDQQRYVRFDEIEHVDLPDGKDSDALRIAVVSGERMLMPVRGGEGRFRDSLSMLRFLKRVVEDLRR